MKLIKVGAAALNQLPLDWAGNRSRILAVIEAARRADVIVLCSPELCTTGYGCEDAFLSPHTIHRGWKTWCRFPMLSGGFEVELAELRSRISQE